MLQINDQFRHKFQYSQTDVDLFAKVSGDTNPLHIDAEAGKTVCLGEILYMDFLVEPFLPKYLELYGWLMVMSI